MKKILENPISSIIVGGGLSALIAAFGGEAGVPIINQMALCALVGTIVNAAKELVSNQMFESDTKTCVINGAIGTASSIAGSLICLL